MIAENGAFARALDADSEGEEGRFYVWSEREVDSVLGPNAEFFKRVYDVTRDGNWEGQNILHRLGENRLSDDATEANPARPRQRRLRAPRLARGRAARLRYGDASHDGRGPALPQPAQRHDQARRV